MKNARDFNVPKLTFNPADQAFYNDPYAAYAEMHALGGPFRWEAYQHICFAGFDDVSALLRDKRLGREVLHVASRQQLGMPDIPDHLKSFYEFESHSMLEREPPVHTRLRRLVNRAFVSRQIERLRPFIYQLANELIDDIENTSSNRKTDLLAQFATPIPVITIAHMLGVPLSDKDKLLDWSHKMVAMYQFDRGRKVEDDAVKATAEFSDYIRHYAQKRRENPEDDLLTLLVSAADDGEKLSEDELVTTAILLLNAGHEATVHAIGNGAKTVLEQFNKSNTVSFDLENTPLLVEEMLRFDAPLHMFTRYVLEPCTISGVDFEVGDVIGLLLGAANRDPSRFINASTFDPHRSDQANVSFGGGIHFCIGAPLARLEMQIAFEVLFKRLPNLKLAEQPAYANRFHFHGLERLVVNY